MKYGWIIGLTMILTACGQVVDPISTVAGETTIPQLGQINSTGANFGNLLQTSFSPSAPYWVFNTGAAFGGSYLSPANGVVTEVGLTTIASTQTNFVTIVHSARLSSRFYGIQTVSVRLGDFVSVGQAVGAFFNSSGIIFQVLLDGRPVCPLSFMSDAFRANFSSFSFNPCL